MLNNVFKSQKGAIIVQNPCISALLILKGTSLHSTSALLVLSGQNKCQFIAHSAAGSVIATLVDGGREQSPLRDKNHH